MSPGYNKSIPQRYKTIILLLILIITKYAFSVTIKIRDKNKIMITNINLKCSLNSESGFAVATTGDISYGKRFLNYFFKDKSPRGFLLSYIMSGKEYVNILRKNSYENAKNKIKNKFSNTKLLVITKQDNIVYINNKPFKIEVVLTKRLHECLFKTEKLLCCCCTDCENECCEKDYGSTYVDLYFKDPQFKNRKLLYTYSHALGASQIFWLTEDNKRKDIYWVHDSEKPFYFK